MGIITKELAVRFAQNLQINDEPFTNECINAWGSDDVPCVLVFVPRCKRKVNGRVVLEDRYYSFIFNADTISVFYNLEDNSLLGAEAEEDFTKFVNDKFDEFMIKEVGADYLEEKLKAITAEYKEDRETLMKPVIAREAKYKEDYVKYSKMLSSINEK